MGCLIDPILANAFLCFYNRKLLEKCPAEFKPVFYRRHVQDIFVLFISTDHFKELRKHFITYHSNMFFTYEKGKNDKISFLNVEIL